LITSSLPVVSTCDGDVPYGLLAGIGITINLRAHSMYITQPYSAMNDCTST